MRKLKLSGNQIQEIPDTIVNLNSLEFLSLHHNQIVALPESINKLSFSSPNLWNLFELDISHNLLKEIPYGIGFLPEVKYYKKFRRAIVLSYGFKYVRL